MLRSLWPRLQLWPIPVRYAASTALVLAAYALRIVTGDTHPSHIYLMFFPVIILSAVLFSRQSGAWAVTLSAGLAAYFLLEPGGFAIADRGEALGLVLFVATGLASVLLIGALQDEVRRLAAENAMIAAAERDKELKLREFSHRVRNDLAMLMALFHFQQRSVEEPSTREALGAAADRVLALARVHHRLEQNGPDALTDAGQFVSGLCQDLRVSLLGLRPITVQVEAESHPLSLNRAVAIGLIINELLTNAIKYAFPDGNGGTVGVRFWREADEFRLTITDDGVGLDIAKSKGSGLGRRLVRSLAAQLGGQCEVDSHGQGTTASLRFPVSGS